jgi:hypothetical protein
MDLAINLIEIISFLNTILALVISIIYRDKKYLFPIQLYLASCIIVETVDLSYAFFAKNQSRTLLSAIQNIQTILEIFLIYCFLYNRLHRKVFQNSIIIFFSIYLTTCFTLWIFKKNSFFIFAPDLLGIEGILITIPCLFYIYEILTSDLIINLKSDSNFIATCGILFYFSISIPIFFCWYILYYISPGSDKILIILNLICSSILILSFMKAYLCPIPDQQQ